jgi:hypothetical protein
MKEAGRYKITLFVSTIVMLNVLTSCSLLEKIEYRDRVVDHYNTVTVHDTLREKTSDSTFVLVTTKGDTVYQTEYRERTRWRDRIVERHDTCFRDSIVTEYKEAIKEVKKVPKIYQYALWFSVACIIFAIGKRLIRIR